MTIYFVTSDPTVQTAVNYAVEDHFPPNDALRALIPWQSTNEAEAGLRRAVQRGEPPDVLLLDTEARGSRDAAPGRAVKAQELLSNVTASMPDLPVVLATRSVGTDFDIEAILRKQVWIWDTTPDGRQSERLAAVLRTALTRPRIRHLCATVRFERDAELLSIEENGVTHLRSRPLLPKAEARDRLHRLAHNDLERYVNLPDVAECWREFGNIGERVFVALFSNMYDALLNSRDPVTIEFWFEMSPGVLAERFGLPLELLNRGDGRNGFLCRLLPMARRVGAMRAAIGNVTVPHVLFVDAGSAAGQSEIVDGQEIRPTGFPSLQASADQQYAALDAMAQAGHCSLERWTLAEFGSSYAGAEASYMEALRRRLQELRPDHHPIDVLHFAGHGVTPHGSETRLVLPGVKPRTVDLLRIGRLAEWLPDGVRLVFLGACQSVSASTAELLHNARGCSVVGFRWEIRAERIPGFVEQFYRAHLGAQAGVAESYRKACHETADDIHTVWASAVALAAD